MSMDIIDTLKPLVAGKFPVAYAKDIQFENGDNVENVYSMQEELKISKESPVFQSGKKKIIEDEETELSICLTRQANMIYISVDAAIELITNSTKTRLKIPEGYRPIHVELFPLYEEDSYSEPCIMKVEPDGDIFIYPPSVELDASGISNRHGCKVWMTSDSRNKI